MLGTMEGRRPATEATCFPCKLTSGMEWTRQQAEEPHLECLGSCPGVCGLPSAAVGQLGGASLGPFFPTHSHRSGGSEAQACRWRMERNDASALPGFACSSSKPQRCYCVFTPRLVLIPCCSSAKRLHSLAPASRTCQADVHVSPPCTSFVLLVSPPLLPTLFPVLHSFPRFAWLSCPFAVHSSLSGQSTCLRSHWRLLPCPWAVRAIDILLAP